MEQRLARRIANQRARLRQWEQTERAWRSYYRRRALAYRKQLLDLGVTPVEIWGPTYKTLGPDKD